MLNYTDCSLLIIMWSFNFQWFMHLNCLVIVWVLQNCAVVVFWSWWKDSFKSVSISEGLESCFVVMLLSSTMVMFFYSLTASPRTSKCLKSRSYEGFSALMSTQCLKKKERERERERCHQKASCDQTMVITIKNRTQSKDLDAVKVTTIILVLLLAYKMIPKRISPHTNLISQENIPSSTSRIYLRRRKNNYI